MVLGLVSYSTKAASGRNSTLQHTRSCELFSTLQQSIYALDSSNSAQLSKLSRTQQEHCVGLVICSALTCVCTCQQCRAVQMSLAVQATVLPGDQVLYRYYQPPALYKH
eukprot:17285-Heterococcus_DN1.PRE.2